MVTFTFVSSSGVLQMFFILAFAGQEGFRSRDWEYYVFSLLPSLLG